MGALARKEILSLKERVAEEENQVAEKMSEIHELQSIVVARDSEMALVKQQYDEVQVRVQQEREGKKVHTKTILDLETELSSSEKKIVEQHQEILKLEGMISISQNELAQKENEIEQVNFQVTELEICINELQKELSKR